MTELKLYRFRLMPAGVVWGHLKGDVVVPFVAANDEHAAHWSDEEPLSRLENDDEATLPAPKPRPKPKLSIV